MRTICHVPIWGNLPTLLWSPCTQHLSKERLLRHPGFRSCSNCTFTPICTEFSVETRRTTATPKKKWVKLLEHPRSITMKKSHPDTLAGDQGTYFTFFTFNYNVCTLNTDLFYFPQTHKKWQLHYNIDTEEKLFFDSACQLRTMYLVIITCHMSLRFQVVY